MLIFWGEKLVSANFYAFCNYGLQVVWVVMGGYEWLQLVKDDNWLRVIWGGYKWLGGLIQNE